MLCNLRLVWDRVEQDYLAVYEDLDGDTGGRLHIRRINATAELIADASGAQSPCVPRAKWAHTLGFRGHFSSKSRRYSVTLGSLRGARRRWRLDRVIQRAQAEGHDVDEVLVIGSWSFAGMGWRTEGDRALAVEAARAAREWRDARRVRFEAKGKKDA